MAGREVWITGQGLLSPLGHGLEASWQALHDPAAVAAAQRRDLLPPFTIHPLVPPDLDRYIKRRGDQRAMGPLMQSGCVAAGMALEQAGLLDDAALLRNTHLMVGVGGGERDEPADEAVLAAIGDTAAYESVLAEKLQNELRPTLFLAQLPNLFAGNISIVFGVAGSSRTFMGEEAAGIDALRVAHERIAGGQGDRFLVGSAFNAVRRDFTLLFHPGGYLCLDPDRPFWQRPLAGMILGSAAAFLVLEAREAAEARGARPLARLAGVASARCRRAPGQAAANAERGWARLGIADGAAVLSAATGVGPVTAEEHGFLAARLAAQGVQVRATGPALGHALECAMLSNVVLGLGALDAGALFPSLTGDPVEAAPAAPVTQLAVSAWGHYRGEGLALIERIGS